MSEGRIQLDQHGRKIYRPDGATLAAFLLDRSPVSIVRGPIGYLVGQHHEDVSDCVRGEMFDHTKPLAHRFGLSEFGAVCRMPAALDASGIHSPITSF